MRAAALAWLAALATACSPAREQSTFPVDATGDGFGNPAVRRDAAACEAGEFCPSVTPTCPSNGSTTISGTVYDPANVNPVYNVAVYVPASRLPLPPLPSGESCGSCFNLFVAPQTTTLTDAAGRFKLASNVPYGQNVPLVIQIGKWRKVYTIPNITACQDNPQPDHSLLLPRNHAEGDLPNIAISTGAEDSLECLPVRMGIDPAEYTGGPAGPGRIHIFTAPNGAKTNAGTSPDPGLTLWDSDADIDRFDVVLLSCEGAETVNMNQQVLWNYLNWGGRVFASHFQYAWFNTGPFATITPPLARASSLWATSRGPS